jgi:hypothetical protein
MAVAVDGVYGTNSKHDIGYPQIVDNYFILLALDVLAGTNLIDDATHDPNWKEE